MMSRAERLPSLHWPGHLHRTLLKFCSPSWLCKIALACRILTQQQIPHKNLEWQSTKQRKQAAKWVRS